MRDIGVAHLVESAEQEDLLSPAWQLLDATAVSVRLLAERLVGLLRGVMRRA